MLRASMPSKVRDTEGSGGGGGGGSGGGGVLQPGLRRRRRPKRLRKKIRDGTAETGFFILRLSAVTGIS
jgi:hypothetical protein